VVEMQHFFFSKILGFLFVCFVFNITFSLFEIKVAIGFVSPSNFIAGLTEL
jgi:hypothetical protein